LVVRMKKNFKESQGLQQWGEGGKNGPGGKREPECETLRKGGVPKPNQPRAKKPWGKGGGNRENTKTLICPQRTGVKSATRGSCRGVGQAHLLQSMGREKYVGPRENSNPVIRYKGKRELMGEGGGGGQSQQVLGG